MTTTVTSVLVYLLLYSIIGTHLASSQPAIAATPQEIDVGLSDTLDLNCTVSLTGWSNVAALISLTISRNTSQTGSAELAIISDFSNGQVNVLTAENLTTDGWFKASGSASVSLHWDYPTDQQADNYICTAEGFDSVGHTLVSTTAVQVSAQSPGLLDVQDKIRQMDIQMKTLVTQLKQSQSKIEALENEVTELKKLEAEVTELKKLELEVSVLKKEKESRISQTFEFSFQYQGHTYYVSRDAVYDAHVSLAVCRSFGGYLVEIDNGNEYNAINSFLKSTHGIVTVFISGTDEVNEGTWTYFSGKPLPYFVAWGPDEPDFRDDQDCLDLHLVQGNWLLSEYICHYDHPVHYTRFMCEVP